MRLSYHNRGLSKPAELPGCSLLLNDERLDTPNFTRKRPRGDAASDFEDVVLHIRRHLNQVRT